MMTNAKIMEADRRRAAVEIRRTQAFEEVIAAKKSQNVDRLAQAYANYRIACVEYDRFMAEMCSIYAAEDAISQLGF
jgi:hypothetical protein